MIFAEDPELRTAALQMLRDKYKMDTPREGLHQSQLSHCLTLSYHDMTDPLPPTDQEVKLYAIGFAFEEVLLATEQTPKAITMDGISLSLDSTDLFGPIDTKTTRMRAAGRKGEGGFQLPEGWRRQFATYAKALGVLSFGIVVMHLVEPELTAWRVSYTQQELDDNWAWYLDRASALESMLAAGDPQTYLWNAEQKPGSWDCEHCRYSLRCQLQASIDRRRT